MRRPPMARSPWPSRAERPLLAPRPGRTYPGHMTSAVPGTGRTGLDGLLDRNLRVGDQPGVITRSDRWVRGRDGPPERKDLSCGCEATQQAKSVMARLGASHGHVELGALMPTSMSLGTGTITIGGDLTVGRIGYGGMQLTGDQVWGEYPDHDSGIALLRHVVDSGVTFIDTADVYGPHSNEQLIREALHPYPEDLVIATKGGFVRGGYEYSTLGAVGNPNYLRQSVHMSLRRLRLKRIDLYYLHSGTATDAPFEE